ncbi:uncharacterized protein J3R85_007718 [Psidium guajava]|nr:uncharacterized protein J3R85_007718 [Psidium guajava]
MSGLPNQTEYYHYTFLKIFKETLTPITKALSLFLPSLLFWSFPSYQSQLSISIALLMPLAIVAAVSRHFRSPAFLPHLPLIPSQGSRSAQISFQALLSALI